MPIGSLSVALLAALSLSYAATAQNGSDSQPPGATSAPGGAHDLWLAGPFGRVPSSVPGTTDHDGQGQSLDAWVRGAPLAVDTGASGSRLGSWTITSDDGSGSDAHELARGSASGEEQVVVFFTGPDAAGTHDVRVEAVTSGGEELIGSWRMDVPDRAMPDDGILDIPAPVILLQSGEGSATGWAGHGCYIFLCVEVGGVPASDRLDGLTVGAGDTLELRLSDGSGFSLGPVTFRPLAGAGEAIRTEATEPTDAPGRRYEVVPPPAGEWLLSLEVVYDRERGYSEAFFRLTSEPTGSSR